MPSSPSTVILDGLPTLEAGQRLTDWRALNQVSEATAASPAGTAD
jgi:hypothetical protein